MNRFLVGLVCLAVVGCSPEEGILSSLGSSFEITAENGLAIAREGWDSVALVNAVSLIESSRQLKAQMPRATQTVDCLSSGSISATTSSNGFNDASVPKFEASGSFKVVTSYSNCSNSIGVFGTKQNGQQTLEQSWTGYDATTDEFAKISIALTYLNLSTSDSVTGETFKDGAINGVVEGATTTTEWDLSLSSSATNDEILTSETTTGVITNDADSYASDGAWIIKGANDTTVVSTVVANGLDISINGAQAVTLTWSELDAL